MKTNQIERMVRACMNHLKKKEHELNITKADVDRAVKVLKVVDTGGSGYGGKNIIQISLSYWQNSNEPRFWKEYDAFNKDPVIGGWEAQNLEHGIWLQVAHEVSHHVQYAICKNIPRFYKIYRKPHGRGFQTIYRYLRRGFINPLLDSNETYFNHKKRKVVLVEK